MKYAALFFSTLVLLPVSAFAELEYGTITIEQNSAGKLGRWELVYPGGVLKSSNEFVTSKKQTVRPRAGPVVLAVEPPTGATSKIVAYLNGEVVYDRDSRQYTIELNNGDEYRFVIQYIFNRNGMLGITSNEPGLQFRMEGPDGKTYRGKTAKSYPSMPVGAYSLYPMKPGCVSPRPYNVAVKQNERTVINIEIDCKGNVRSTKKEETRPVPSRRNAVKNVQSRESHRASTHRIRRSTSPGSE